MTVADPAKCEEYLRRIGYYRLSAYWFPFRQLGQNSNGTFYLQDQFKPDTTFKHGTDLYAYDKGLRLIVLDAIERIEVSVRTEFALALGAIGPLAHRDQRNFIGRFSQFHPPRTQSRYQEWLYKLDEKAAHSKEEFADHFRTKYVGEFMPIWIAVELLDFSPLSIALSQLKHAEQQKISASYGGTSFRLIQSWIRSLCNVRNICAHHSRLWNKPLVNQPAIPRAGEAPDLDHLATAPDTNKRIYAALAVMRFLLKEINPRTKWADRLKDHVATFPQDAPNISLRDAGFPDDWDQLPLWN
ncbi:Abi family protein [Sinorhizobium fredii]|uniref:Abi family protein n=1 Tax=Rhizobium fredii TaxID=380 RepID=UPI003511CD5D